MKMNEMVLDLRACAPNSEPAGILRKRFAWRAVYPDSRRCCRQRKCDGRSVPSESESKRAGESS